jgi:hypothetical protein
LFEDADDLLLAQATLSHSFLITVIGAENSTLKRDDLAVAGQFYVCGFRFKCRLGFIGEGCKRSKQSGSKDYEEIDFHARL